MDILDDGLLDIDYIIIYSDRDRIPRYSLANK